tara:strand:+ start:3783 stop:4742 length:960 start_codon:yes stop_codon:yes gene_type:complete
MLNKEDKIYVAGHKGLVGSSIVRFLQKKGFSNLILRNHKQLDLTDQAKVEDFFSSERPDIVIIAAARVGGIHANNTYPAEFIYQNLMIESNLIHSSFINNVKRLLFLGSTCIYPRDSRQPMKEDDLLTGVLEPTNEPYAIAKIAGIKLCESYNRQYGTDYRSIMPTSLYGTNDNFHPTNSHVIPALIRRFHEAKINHDSEVVVWGTGEVKREFLYVDDLADASFFVLDLNKDTYEKHTSPLLSHLNVGSGSDLSIKNLASLVKEVTNFQGKITYDSSKPDGTPRKLVDISRLSNIGWKAKTDLVSGLSITYKWYLENIL